MQQVTRWFPCGQRTEFGDRIVLARREHVDDERRRQQHQQAVDEAPNGVRVNSVSPGNVYTPLWQEAIDQASNPEEYRYQGEAAQLLGRMGNTEEVGKLCLFIASQATFTTGVDHIISGGAELGYAQKSRNGVVNAELELLKR